MYPEVESKRGGMLPSFAGIFNPGIDNLLIVFGDEEATHARRCLDGFARSLLKQPKQYRPRLTLCF